MGCGNSSSTDVVSRDNKQPKIQSPQLHQSFQPPPAPVIVREVQPEPKIEGPKIEGPKIENPMKENSIQQVPQGRSFLFGQSPEQRKIVYLDCTKLKMSVVSCRKNSQWQSVPEKYKQPNLETVFEDSQELAASVMFNHNSHPPYNCMLALYLAGDAIFLCGGVDSSESYFSEEAFLFKPDREGQGVLIGNRFSRLPNMHTKRHSHMGVHYRAGKMNSIFVFGGASSECAPISSCEQYSLEESKWRSIPPMKMARSTGFALVYRDNIYVFGGYTAQGKRTKLIEVFHPHRNSWDSLNVKLHRGIENGVAFSLKPNQFLILGGNMEGGALKAVIKVNLQEETYVWHSTMKHPRTLQKGIKCEEALFVFGGNREDHFEKYSVKTKGWTELPFSYKQTISPEHIERYQLATASLEVVYEEVEAKSQGNLNPTIQIFGHDDQPCILELVLNKLVLKRKAVPMALRLRANMGTLKITEGKYFIGGGVDCQGCPSRAAYLYYSGTNKAIEIAKMDRKKYNFAAACTATHVYLFGGQSSPDNILATCQKYSIAEEKWINLPELMQGRTESHAVLCGTTIYVIGGRDEFTPLNLIEIFHTETDTFSEHTAYLPLNLNLNRVYLYSERGVLHVFGGNETSKKQECHELRIECEDGETKVEMRELMSLKPYKYVVPHEGAYYLLSLKETSQWTPNPTGPQTLLPRNVIGQIELQVFNLDSFSLST